MRIVYFFFQLRIFLRLLTVMVIATGVSSIMSLQFFLQVSWSTMIKKYVAIKEFYKVAGEIGETLDIAVLVCSNSAFFVSLLQLFFVLKLQKSHNTNTTISIDYLERTSFMRIIIYSFWFLAVILLMTAVLLLFALNPQRGTISRGVGVSLGVSAIVFCAVITLKSIRFWTRSSPTSTTVDNYKNFSTLV
ncbi:Tat pathway signal sequence domain protein [Dictyocaulus viviparus]|uniref:Tat pathway signal sequence domain protein n=1 Tax=Dictyocaulus viviparus TaxID=29172 RepID=A0A0D8XFX0_DICVI|nr:Tat pathway signal sequence domain protein [Dictyocaulus viviparus]